MIPPATMENFSRLILNMPLYTYQVEFAQYVLDLVNNHRAEDVVVEMSRQSGKNETSAHLETAILARYRSRGGVIVKAAPTWKPQIVRSKHRLEARLRQAQRVMPSLTVRGREGYIYQVGEAAINFLSGAQGAHVVGDTASLLMEIDEVQDFDQEKYDKDFSPMRAATSPPAVFYGTTWTDITLLERVKLDIAQGRTAGRVFRVPWTRVAEENRAYGDYVEREIKRLGEDHPLIRSQYALIPIEHQGYLLKPQQLRLLVGDHAQRSRRESETWIVAGVDFAGADEDAGGMLSQERAGSSRDSVAVTIGSVEMLDLAAGLPAPFVRIVDRYEWVNVHPASLHTALYDILERNWHADRIVGDATGIGSVSMAFLKQAIDGPGNGSRVQPVVFDGAWMTHTRLAFQYLGMVNGARLKDYQVSGFDPLLAAQAPRPSANDIDRHAWWQRGHARLEARPGARVRAYVPETEGHDDVLVSEMLMVDAAQGMVGILAPLDDTVSALLIEYQGI